MEENQELLLNQIIDLHGKVVYTYTTHHKIQNRLERINKGVKISQIILTAVSTVGFFGDCYNKSVSVSVDRWDYISIVIRI